MRGAYGKPYGLAARVDIGQVSMIIIIFGFIFSSKNTKIMFFEKVMISIRCKDSNAHVAKTALRRAM